MLPKVQNAQDGKLGSRTVYKDGPKRLNTLLFEIMSRLLLMWISASKALMNAFYPSCDRKKSLVGRQPIIHDDLVPSFRPCIC